MKLLVSKKIITAPAHSVRRLGYGLLNNRRSGEQSFVKRFNRDLYPRFHLYVEDAGENWSLNLHLDQRAPVYSGVTAHSGDYDGAVVEAEIARIKNLLKL